MLSPTLSSPLSNNYPVGAQEEGRMKERRKELPGGVVGGGGGVGWDGVGSSSHLRRVQSGAFIPTLPPISYEVLFDIALSFPYGVRPDRTPVLFRILISISMSFRCRLRFRCAL